MTGIPTIASVVTTRRPRRRRLAIGPDESPGNDHHEMDRAGVDPVVRTVLRLECFSGSGGERPDDAVQRKDLEGDDRQPPLVDRGGSARAVGDEDNAEVGGNRDQRSRWTFASQIASGALRSCWRRRTRRNPAAENVPEHAAQASRQGVSQRCSSRAVRAENATDNDALLRSRCRSRGCSRSRRGVRTA